jgi:hypothetical protein
MSNATDSSTSLAKEKEVNQENIRILEEITLSKKSAYKGQSNK